jgi:hypothetical protein
LDYNSEDNEFLHLVSTVNINKRKLDELDKSPDGNEERRLTLKLRDLKEKLLNLEKQRRKRREIFGSL